MSAVTRLAIAPVKGLGLAHPEEVLVEPHGVTENRRFHLLDERGRFVNLLRRSDLVRVSAAYDAREERLRLEFPDGAVVEDVVAVADPVVTDFYGRDVPGRVVVGPWAEALSRYAGMQLRLVRSDEPGAAVDRSRGAVSLMSEASLEELGRHAGADGAVDGRRFRMLVTVGGVAPHEEDGWVGRRVRIGEALVRPLGPVGRCAITTQNPDTGDRDLDTLRTIKEYRGLGPRRELDFGVYGEVLEPGRVRVGDAVEVE
ncbi:MAG TPA: MOSC domain-containing protein [Gaiellaceae bacterium]|nr:MOSC domain-containing protein [Gaiellaceae bacterium]